MKLRVGVVGLGPSWEKRHRPALWALGDRFEVRAICEQVAMRAREAAVEFKASQVDGYRAMVEREDVDALLMLAPQWFGYLPILAACEAGKAIYCASALDLDAKQATVVRDRVAKAGVAFMAEFARRHSPATLRLKELIATALGPPRLLFCHQRLFRFKTCSERPLPGCDTLPMSRELIELVDWCRYVVGSEPSSVQGVTHHDATNRGGHDYRMMSLDFSPPGKPGTNAVAQISCGHYMPSEWKEAISFRPPAGLQVCCERGVAFVDLPSTVIWFDEAGRHEERLDFERPVGEQLLSQFFRAVTSLIRKTADLDDAYRAVRIVKSAEESAADGQRRMLESFM